MYVYVKRCDNHQCKIIDSTKIHHFSTPIDKYKKYKVKDDNDSTFEVVIIFYHELLDELNQQIEKERVKVPPVALLKSGSDFTDVDDFNNIEKRRIVTTNQQTVDLLQSKLNLIKDRQMIHCRNNVYISMASYINAKNSTQKAKVSSKNPFNGSSDFVRDVAMSIIGAEELKKSSVTGQKCNRLNTTLKPSLDPKLVGAVHGILEHYLKTEKQFNDIDIALERKHVGSYIAQKICDLHCKPKKKQNNGATVTDGDISREIY